MSTPMNIRLYFHFNQFTWIDIEEVEESFLVK